MKNNKSTHYFKLLNADLDKRTNLEKSRNFDSRKLAESLDSLQVIVESIREKYHLESKIFSVVGSNGKGSTAFFFSDALESFGL